MQKCASSECENNLSKYQERKHRKYCSKACYDKHRHEILKIPGALEKFKESCKSAMHRPDVLEKLKAAQASESTRTKLSDSVRKSWTVNKEAHVDAIKLACGSETTRQKHTEHILRRIEEGFTPQTTSFRGDYLCLKSDVVERYDSSYEFFYMKILDVSKDVVTWTKKHKLRVSYRFNDSNKMYVPDFLVKRIDGTSTVVEIKGYKSDVVDFKNNAAIEFCTTRGWSFSFIGHDALNELALATFGETLQSLVAKQFYSTPHVSKV